MQSIMGGAPQGRKPQIHGSMFSQASKGLALQGASAYAVRFMIKRSLNRRNPVLLRSKRELLRSSGGSLRIIACDHYTILLSQGTIQFWRKP